MRTLSHPNVVRFHALVEPAGELAIAMEYVDGDDLESVIARHVARARLAGTRECSRGSRSREPGTTSSSSSALSRGCTRSDSFTAT